MISAPQAHLAERWRRRRETANGLRVRWGALPLDVRAYGPVDNICPAVASGN
jgi:hypothetical protein